MSSRLAVIAIAIHSCDCSVGHYNFLRRVREFVSRPKSFAGSRTLGCALSPTLPVESRQLMIDAFNQSLVELLITSDQNMSDAEMVDKESLEHFGEDAFPYGRKRKRKTEKIADESDDDVDDEEVADDAIDEAKERGEDDEGESTSAESADGSGEENGLDVDNNQEDEEMQKLENTKSKEDEDKDDDDDDSSLGGDEFPEDDISDEELQDIGDDNGGDGDNNGMGELSGGAEEPEGEHSNKLRRRRGEVATFTFGGGNGNGNTSARKGRAQQEKNKGDKHFSAHRGLDLVGVKCVINFDIPRSRTAYVHRVGRTGRGGQSGVALTLVDSKNSTDAAIFSTFEPRKGAHEHLFNFRPLDISMADIQCFKYRVTDVFRGVTRATVRSVRSKELQAEILASKKMRQHFQANPLDAAALKAASAKRQDVLPAHLFAHLRRLPDYLVPKTTMSPVTPVLTELTAQVGPEYRNKSREQLRRRLNLPKPTKTDEWGLPLTRRRQRQISKRKRKY